MYLISIVLKHFHIIEVFFLNNEKYYNNIMYMKYIDYFDMNSYYRSTKTRNNDKIGTPLIAKLGSFRQRKVNVSR